MALYGPGRQIKLRSDLLSCGVPDGQDAQPGLWEALDALIKPETRADSTCPLRWTTKSTRTLATELAAQGFAISHETVARVLRQTGYRLQASRQGVGAGPSNREAQFRHLCDTVAQHLNAGEPVISVSTTKRQAHPRDQAVRDQNLSLTGAPVRVEVHDFPDPAPHGSGWIPGPHADESFGAVGRWWDEVGSVAYPGATRLLITGDASGPNSLHSPR
ncbi:MAG: ISAzo13-like element transposase-related protein [Acidimicrobiales bacterium]